jgi:endonuclease/exonuclease/phosphatase family metal-dependent hydrolase
MLRRARRSRGAKQRAEQRAPVGLVEFVPMKAPIVRWSAFVALVALLGGCGDDESVDEGGPAKLRFSTFNAGLAYGFVPYAEERSPLVPPALAELPVDVLCLQEVWLPADVEAARAATASVLPEAMFFDDAQAYSETAACAADDVAPLIACAEANCGQVPEAECVLTECSAEFNAQTPECTTCLGANVGGSIDVIAAACGEGSALYAYDGAFGVGLLTNQTVTSRDELVFESTLNRRGVLHAELATESGPLHVYCTHLTANLSINYPGPADSWEAEQAAQIDALLAYVEQTSGGEPAVVLGDLNAGPEREGITAELPDNFARLAQGGWVAPYLEGNPDCTYCSDNPLVGNPGDPKVGVVIDHVLVRSSEEGTFEAARALDADVTIETADGAVTTKLSDHYGVSVTWTRSP